MGKDKFTAAVIIAVIITVITGAVLTWQLVCLNQKLEDVNTKMDKIAAAAGGTVTQTETGEEESKLLADYTVTTSQMITKDGVRKVSVSITPIEFSEGTVATMKIGDETFELKQKDGSFAGTGTTDSFLKQNITITLSDGDTVRTEILDNVIESVYGPLDTEKSEARIDVEYGNNTNRYYGEATIVPGEKEGIPTTKLVTFVVTQQNKDLYTKEIKANSTTVSIDKKVKVEGKEEAKMFIRVVGSDGYIYEYSVFDSGENSNNNYDYFTALTLVRVKTSQGNVLWEYKDELEQI